VEVGVFLSSYWYIVKIDVIVVEGDVDSLQLKKSASLSAIKSESTCTGGISAAATRGCSCFISVVYCKLL